MTTEPDDIQLTTTLEIFLGESGVPPQEGETAYDAAGNYYRVLRSVGPGAASGWWIIEGKLIN